MEALIARKPEYLLARVLEEFHLWRSGKNEPSGRDWYES
jgi:hypothetical protein